MRLNFNLTASSNEQHATPAPQHHSHPEPEQLLRAQVAPRASIEEAQ